MGFTRPSDMAIIVGVGMLVILTFSLGISSVNDQYGQTGSSPVFTSANQELGSFRNTSNAASEGLATSSGQSESPSFDNIAVASFNAILDLGGMVSTSITLLNEAADALHIPSYFLVIVIGILLVVFAVVTYSWVRGVVLQ